MHSRWASRRTTPSARSVSSLCPRNLLERIVGAGTAGRVIVNSIAYHPSARMVRMSFGNGVRTSREYDPRLRLSRLSATAGALDGDPRLVDLEYQFDGASNVRSIVDHRDASRIGLGSPRHNSQAFEYDDLYPQYGFAKHKGYPTKAHREALARLGPTPIHRRSFGPVKKQLELSIT